MSNEDQVVPALGMKKPIDFNTVEDLSQKEDVSASQEELSLANIPVSQKPIADAMVPLFGEQTACLIFARAWANREKGIQNVISDLDKVLSKDADAHNTVLQVLTECLKDKVQQVTTKAFLLVEEYIKGLHNHKQHSPKNDVSNTEKMLVQLLDRLADPKFTSKAEQCFFELFKVEQYDGQFLLAFLLKTSSYVNKNMSTSVKHMVPRLQILNTIIEKFTYYENDIKKLSQANFPFPQVIAKIKEGADASSPEQRKVSLQLVVSLYN